MIPLPKKHIQIHDELIAYRGEYNGRLYVNIRKTYKDKDTGQPALGKGLTLSDAQWEALKEKFASICKELDSES